MDNCPTHTGLTSIRVRFMIDPDFTNNSTSLATHVVDCFQDVTIQQLVYRIIGEPSNWTIKMAQTSPLGLQIATASVSQVYIKDITITRTLQMPKTALFTFELGTIFGN